MALYSLVSWFNFFSCFVSNLNQRRKNNIFLLMKKWKVKNFSFSFWLFSFYRFKWHLQITLNMNLNGRIKWKNQYCTCANTLREVVFNLKVQRYKKKREVKSRLVNIFIYIIGVSKSTEASKTSPISLLILKLLL